MLQLIEFENHVMNRVIGHSGMAAGSGEVGVGSKG